MFTTSSTTKTIHFPQNCARCNSRPGTERFHLTGKATLASTTTTSSVDIPICQTCLLAIQDEERELQEKKKVQDRKFAITAGIIIGIGLVIGVVIGLVAKKSVLLSALYSGIIGFIIAGIIAMIAEGKSKKVKDPKDFVRFDTAGLGILQFDNREYQREFNKLNSIPDFLPNMFGK